MKIKLFYSAIILLTFSCLSSYAQVYRTSWDTPLERQGWSQYHLGLDSSTSWYFTGVAVLQGEVLVHAAPPVSSTNVMDNWIVSPAFNFSAGGSIDSLIINLSGVSFPTITDTLAIYLITGAHNPALSTSKQLLKQYTSTEYMQNMGYANELPINIPPTVGMSYLAFRYKTVNGQFDALFDALQVTANFTNATTNIRYSDEDVKIYPNPGYGQFKIELSDIMGALTELNILDAKGSLIKRLKKSKSIDLSVLSPGVYFIQLKTYRAGDVVKKIIVK